MNEPDWIREFNAPKQTRLPPPWPTASPVNTGELTGWDKVGCITFLALAVFGAAHAIRLIVLRFL